MITMAEIRQNRVLHDVEGAHLLRGDLLPERITAPIDLRADDEPRTASSCVASSTTIDDASSKTLASVDSAW